MSAIHPSDAMVNGWFGWFENSDLIIRESLCGFLFPVLNDVSDNLGVTKE